MQIWGVTMVRDEADIIELTVRHMFDQGIDRLLVADNLSADGTRPILDRLAAELPVTVVDDPDPAYRQSEKMTALAQRAADLGADWIVPFDADEIWRAYVGTVRDAIERSSGRAKVLAAPMYDHHPRPSLRAGTVIDRMPWNRTLGWPKVAFRWEPGAVINMGNHGVTGVEGDAQWGELLVDHYPFRSYRQYRRKMRQGAQGLDLAGAAPWLAAHWREIGGRSDLGIWVCWWRVRLYPKLRRCDRATFRR